MDEQKLKSIIESLLFISGEPISVSRLSKISTATKNEIEEALKNLANDCQGRGLKIVRLGDSVQLVTDPSNTEYISQLVNSEANTDISRSALETLSIIAYKGPITRMQIEAVRGVNCTYILRNLLMRGLVERREAKNIRGFSYEISMDMLKYLGLQKMAELPAWQELTNDDKVNQLLKESTDTPVSL